MHGMVKFHYMYICIGVCDYYVHLGVCPLSRLYAPSAYRARSMNSPKSVEAGGHRHIPPFEDNAAAVSPRPRPRRRNPVLRQG